VSEKLFLARSFLLLTNLTGLDRSLVTRGGKVLSIVKIRQQKNLPTDDKVGHDIQTIRKFPLARSVHCARSNCFREMSLTR
jgi:hypothetical protein